jgi:hypothetical protein
LINRKGKIEKSLNPPRADLNIDGAASRHVFHSLEEDGQPQRTGNAFSKGKPNLSTPVHQFMSFARIFRMF